VPALTGILPGPAHDAIMPHRDLSLPVASIFFTRRQTLGEMRVAQAGITQDDSMTLVKLERQNARQALLLRAYELLTGSQDLARTLPPLVDLALEAGAAQSARLVLASTNAGATVYAAGHLPAAHIPLDDHLLQLSAARHEVLVISPPELPAAALPATLPAIPGTIAVWPLHAGDQWLGALWLAYEGPHPPDGDTISLLAQLARQITGAVINARLLQQARSERKTLEAVLDGAIDAILVVDGEQRLAFINGAAQTLLDIDPAEAVNQPVAVALEAYPQLLRLLEEDGATTEAATWEGPSSRTFTVRLAPIEDAGTANGFVLVLHDITANVLLRRNQQEIVHLMGHDIRTPLTVLKSASEMLGMFGDLDSRQSGFLGKILNSVKQIEALANNIEDAGRWDPQTGFYQMSREPVDIARIVTGIVADQQDVAARQNVRLSTIIPPEVPVVYGDKLMLERALANLVSNAIKYSPNGGDVTVAITVTGSALTICVSDTGLGIAKENLDHLFKRGGRIVTPEINRRNIKGSGLGLFIVRNVALRHDGDVWVESELGKGSRFYFSLPLSSTDGDRR